MLPFLPEREHGSAGGRRKRNFSPINQTRYGSSDATSCLPSAPTLCARRSADSTSLPSSPPLSPPLHCFPFNILHMELHSEHIVNSLVFLLKNLASDRKTGPNLRHLFCFSHVSSFLSMNTTRQSIQEGRKKSCEKEGWRPYIKICRIVSITCRGVLGGGRDRGIGE